MQTATDYTTKLINTCLNLRIRNEAVITFLAQNQYVFYQIHLQQYAPAPVLY